LRVLQEGEVTPVGSNATRRVDIRVIAATNSDLARAMQDGKFRDDLYYRLSAFPLTLPALRERKEDLPALIDHFVAAAAEAHGKRIAGLEPAAFTLLDGYDWPGNVRELENEIDRAVALTVEGSVIAAATLSPKLRRPVRAAAGASLYGPTPTERPATEGPAPASGASPSASATALSRGDPVPLRAARAEFESRFIADALAANGGNVSRTARALGLSRVTLQKKLKTLGLR